MPAVEWSHDTNSARAYLSERTHRSASRRPPDDRSHTAGQSGRRRAYLVNSCSTAMPPQGRERRRALAEYQHPGAAVCPERSRDPAASTIRLWCPCGGLFSASCPTSYLRHRWPRKWRVATRRSPTRPRYRRYVSAPEHRRIVGGARWERRQSGACLYRRRPDVGADPDRQAERVIQRLDGRGVYAGGAGAERQPARVDVVEEPGVLRTPSTVAVVLVVARAGR